MIACGGGRIAPAPIEGSVRVVTGHYRLCMRHSFRPISCVRELSSPDYTCVRMYTGGCDVERPRVSFKERRSGPGVSAAQSEWARKRFAASRQEVLSGFNVVGGYAFGRELRLLNPPLRRTPRPSSPTCAGNGFDPLPRSGLSGALYCFRAAL